jgi:Zn-dependent protease/predicted transcriptional regulator
MKWSWKIGQVAGIGIYVHFTFVFLLALLPSFYYGEGGGWTGVLFGVVLLVSLFTIVVLHELGHALTARRFGVRTRDITLLPIGGVARLERIPEDPRQELLIAIAGPAVNVVLALLCLGGMLVIAKGSELLGLVQSVHEALASLFEPRGEAAGLRSLPLLGVAFLAQLTLVNIYMVAFNLLPAFPMDGGRVLRALLAMRMEYVRATQVAAAVGQGMAFLFGIAGLLTHHYILLFIALFVWMGATSEASMVEVRHVLGGVPVRSAMITRFQTVAPDTLLRTVGQHILAGFQQDFPVVDGDRVVGMLTRSDLLKALARNDHDNTVASAMEQKFEQADPAEMLHSVFSRLQNCRCHSFPVVERGRLVGVIDMENVGEFIALRQALRAGATAEARS